MWDELYGLETQWWMLINGVVLMVVVMLWPMPKLNESQSSGAIGLFRLLFLTMALIFMVVSRVFNFSAASFLSYRAPLTTLTLSLSQGPATNGILTLVAVVGLTVFYLFQVV